MNDSLCCRKTNVPLNSYHTPEELCCLHKDELTCPVLYPVLVSARQREDGMIAEFRACFTTLLSFLREALEGRIFCQPKPTTSLSSPAAHNPSPIEPTCLSQFLNSINSTLLSPCKGHCQAHLRKGCQLSDNQVFSIRHSWAKQ